MFKKAKKEMTFWEAKKRLKTQKMSIPGNRYWFDPLLHVNFKGTMGISTFEESVPSDFRRVDPA